MNFHEKKIPPSLQSNVENEEVNSLFQIVLFTFKKMSNLLGVETFVKNHKKINLFNFGWKMPSLSEWIILLNFWLSKKLKRSKKTIINQGDVFFVKT